jgi:hypothetical protein
VASYRRHRRWIQLNYKSVPLLRYRVRPTAVLERRAWQRSNDSPVWRGVAVGFMVTRGLRGFAGRRPEVIAVERLKPGQRLAVQPISMATKADRKAAKRWTPGSG